MRKFSGQSAIVSGGARGQGAVEVRMLVEQGAGVVIADLLEEEGERLAAELGDRATFLRLDVANEEDWKRATDAAEALGSLSMLVNNAGIFQPRPILETSTELFVQHFNANQLGVFQGIKAVVEPMRKAGGGSIVNISSTAGLQGSPNMIAYGATKWAVRGMTKVAANELGPYNIRVNSIHPGGVATQMTAFADPAVWADYMARLPLGRAVECDDVAAAVIFLLSDQARSITGAELKIDAGAVL